MEQFLVNLVQASIHGSVVILAVILLRLLLQKAPRKYICLLWLLAGIRLLLPIEIRSDLSLQPKLTLLFAGLSNLPWAHLLSWVWAAVALCFGLYSLVSYWKLKKEGAGGCADSRRLGVRQDRHRLYSGIHPAPDLHSHGHDPAGLEAHSGA